MITRVSVPCFVSNHYITRLVDDNYCGTVLRHRRPSDESPFLDSMSLEARIWSFAGQYQSVCVRIVPTFTDNVYPASQLL
jgi:hypothetical protein